MTYLTAQITDVAIGKYIIAGLMDEFGKYYVGVPQIATEFQFTINHASRDIKSLMDKGFQFAKLKTSLNPKAINAIPLNQFEVLLAKLDRKGNLKAQQLRDDLAGLSLHQLFADAFNQKFEALDRQNYLKARQSGKTARKLFSDAVKDYIVRHPERSDGFKKFAYSNATDRLYRGIFSKSTKQLKEQKQLPDKVDLRDYFEDYELTQLEHKEVLAAYLINQEDMEPDNAVDKALQFYSQPIA